jgi:hypothetical protein
VSKNENFSLPVQAHLDRNGLPNAPLHFFGFPAQHGRLICYTDSLQMHVGSNPANARLELVEERVFVAAVPDIVANVIGIGESQDHDIMSASVAEARESWLPWSLRVPLCRE